MKKAMILFSCAAVMLFSFTQAQAVTYYFDAVSSNNLSDVATGETYLRMDITDPSGDNNIAFRFYWSADLTATQPNLGISDFYFYDGLYMAKLPTITPGSGDMVNLSKDQTGNSLPDGQEVGLKGDGQSTKSWYGAGSTNQANAVQTNEEVTFTFNLLQKPDSTYYAFQDVINALDAWIALTNTDKQKIIWSDKDGIIKPPPPYLAIGLYLQGYASGGSESFVPVPLPGAVLLLGAGLARLVAYARRRQD